MPKEKRSDWTWKWTTRINAGWSLGEKLLMVFTGATMGRVFQWAAQNWYLATIAILLPAAAATGVFLLIARRMAAREEAENFAGLNPGEAHLLKIFETCEIVMLRPQEVEVAGLAAKGLIEPVGGELYAHSERVPMRLHPCARRALERRGFAADSARP